jgi:hypothetical protein
MTAMRSFPLAERRAQARGLDERLKEHRRECLHCMTRSPCGEARELAAELAMIRDEIKHWFDPGPDQGVLFEPERSA